MFHENRLGINKSVITLFTCFVRIPARNSVNPVIQITRFPTVNMSFSENVDTVLMSFCYSLTLFFTLFFISVQIIYLYQRIFYDFVSLILDGIISFSSVQRDINVSGSLVYDRSRDIYREFQLNVRCDSAILISIKFLVLHNDQLNKQDNSKVSQYIAPFLNARVVEAEIR